MIRLPVTPSNNVYSDDTELADVDFSELEFEPLSPLAPPPDPYYYTDIFSRDDEGRLLDGAGRVRYDADGSLVELPNEQEVKTVWEEEEHPRAGNGEFTSGGAGATSPTKPRPVRVPAEDPGDVAQKLRDAHLVVDATIQRYCEEHNERNIAHALGGMSLPDSEPVDVRIPPRRPKHGIELKTMVTNKRGTVRMSRAARARKAAWEQETGAVLHTIVLDDRKVFNANGDGQHDESKRVIYYRRGCGNLSVGSMHKCKNMAEVRRLMAMSDDDLPADARRLTPAQIKAWIEEGDM